jgi:flagellar motor component MotA
MLSEAASASPSFWDRLAVALIPTIVAAALAFAVARLITDRLERQREQHATRERLVKSALARSTPSSATS